MIGLKPDEQMLKEWALDCVKFKGSIYGRYWTVDSIKKISEAIKTKNVAAELMGVEKSAKEQSKYLIWMIGVLHGEHLEMIHNWLTEMGRISEATPRWVARWTSFDYMWHSVKADYERWSGKKLELMSPAEKHLKDQLRQKDEQRKARKERRTRMEQMFNPVKKRSTLSQPRKLYP